MAGDGEVLLVENAVDLDHERDDVGHAHRVEGVLGGELLDAFVDLGALASYNFV